MDVLSQGVFGALWASQTAPQNEVRRAMVLGLIAGLAPDLDVLIRSSTDSLLGLEYHRHFTHAFAFIPIGALICVLVLRPLFFKSLSWKRAYLYAFLGYASHGLLDAFTSYGTLLLWPFSNMRVAWDSIAIVDLFFTLPLLIFLIIGARTKRSRFLRVALVWAVVYLGLGFVQRDRAREVVGRLAESRGHTPLRLSAKPSIGNLWLFRGLYETETAFYADAVRVPFFGSTRVYPGSSLEKFDPHSLDIPEDSVLMRDIERFAWFSDNYLCRHPAQEDFIVGDFRYALLPNGTRPLWGIVIDPENPETHALFDSFRTIGANDWAKFRAMLLGRNLPAIVTQD
jgi:inner membrane protein